MKSEKDKRRGNTWAVLDPPDPWLQPSITWQKARYFEAKSVKTSICILIYYYRKKAFSEHSRNAKRRLGHFEILQKLKFCTEDLTPNDCICYHMSGNLHTLLYVHLTLLCFTINLGAWVIDVCKVFLVRLVYRYMLCPLAWSLTWGEACQRLVCQGSHTAIQQEWGQSLSVGTVVQTSWRL
jgi:hypothetical protein